MTQPCEEKGYGPAPTYPHGEKGTWPGFNHCTGNGVWGFSREKGSYINGSAIGCLLGLIQASTDIIRIPLGFLVGSFTLG